MMEKKYYPLSRTQKEIIFFEDECPGTAINSICALYQCEGDFADTMEKVVNSLVEHEQSFRLRMHKTEDGEWVQYEVPYEYFAVPRYPEAVTYEKMQEIAQAKSEEPFEVADSPLYKFEIFQGEGITYICCTLHHIINDGCGMALLGIMLTYGWRAVEGIAPYEWVHHRFTDFIEKENSPAKQKRREKDAIYWQEKFADWNGPACIKPGFEAPDDAYDGTRIERQLTEEEDAEVNAFFDKHGISSAVLFQTALIIYLYTKNPDRRRIDIGNMIMNRPTAADKAAIGNYAAEVMLCVPVAPDMTVMELIDAVGQANKDSYRHSSYLHDDIVEYLSEKCGEEVSICDIEFGFMPSMVEQLLEDVGGELPLTGEAFSAGIPETTMEYMIYNLTEGPLLLKMDYRLNMFSAEEAQQLFDDIWSIAQRCTRENCTLKEF